jgi:hypothetical protein
VYDQANNQSKNDVHLPTISKHINKSCRELFINSLIYPHLLPLIRLRVETLTTLNINKNKIAHSYKGRVANPEEMLKLLIKKKISDTKHTQLVSVDISDILHIYH